MSIASASPVKLTYDEYALIPNDGNRHEIVDGWHYMNAAPNPRHQVIAKFLSYMLYEQIELKGFGDIYFAPVDVQLGPHDVVQPDIVVVLKENHIVEETRIVGIPDLVIEILSPSNRDHDTKLKRRRYEQLGVPEYWIVDPYAETIEQLRLSTSLRFQPPTLCTSSIRWEALPGGIELDLTRVW